MNVLEDFLCSIKQSTVLNGQHSFWSDVVAGVSHGSILEPLLFLIYINGLSNAIHSSWSDVVAEVPQASILGPLLFLIYINDLSDGFHSNPKLFADDTSLFSTAHDVTETTNELNSDLQKINIWVHRWKMSFDLIFLNNLMK